MPMINMKFWLLGISLFTLPLAVLPEIFRIQEMF